MLTQTCSKVYGNVSQLQTDSARMQRQGWEEVSTTSYGKGWGCLKTLFLWWLMPILAIFGRRPDGWRAVYKRQVSEQELAAVNAAQRKRRWIALAVAGGIVVFVSYCAAVTLVLQWLVS